ncbi:MAG: bifunctional alpha,alpha-trehalose-phosphate synthase (UDP-forming)/trehalose-phosphatase, partial [Blastocatellia bacterium]|nr:bifunctional alpha,alpha-trehalose-phosphate synthase (UDP-forming)/trehalose-phosphatase [Blastocatellia bacterium]
MGRLLIVSNRLPVTLSIDNNSFKFIKSSGGLATGLSSIISSMNTIWFGWPGDTSFLTSRQRLELEVELEKLGSVPVYLSSDEIEQFYEGYSNSVLWPLFHYLLDKVKLDAVSDWMAYKRVNELFAEKVVSYYQSDDIVWIHDYHLSLLPAMLRELIPNARIGFFLHIPFPSAELFRVLPARKEIVEGMLGADLIGFHTYTYTRHFETLLLHLLELEPKSDKVFYQNREIALSAFPMGIDAERFNRLALSGEVALEVEKLKSTNCEKILLSVDRLDYTKGIPRRLLAIEKLLESESELRGKLKLIQIVVPSRTEVDSYQQFRRQIDELVGRINATYGTVNSLPIHYLYRSVSEVELVALYKAADLMLVTPLRDGMNLVSKEFIASRVDESGVLLLSEFAGAAEGLGEALLVNPYDIDAVAKAIKIGFDMSVEEKRSRMKALRRRVFTQNVEQWAESFLGSIPKTALKQPKEMFVEEDLNNLLSQITEAEKLLLLLDYDGTLVPLQKLIELSQPDEELLKLLKTLSEDNSIDLHIVSGRPKEILENWLGFLPIGLHAEHGFWSRSKPGTEWVAACQETNEWKQPLINILEAFTARTPGSLIEVKTANLSWHYRMSNPEYGPRQAELLCSVLRASVGDMPIEVVNGDKIVEVKLKDIHKGIVAEGLLKNYTKPPLVVAIGDDKTDE